VTFLLTGEIIQKRKEKEQKKGENIFLSPFRTEKHLNFKGDR
jgi:hypothetical protein